MKKKFLSLWFAAALAAVTLTGCGQTAAISQAPAEEETPETSAAAPAEDKAAEDKAADDKTAEDNGTLKVSYPTGNIRVAINILALEKGYFEEEGVTVEPVNIAGQDALTAIAGDNDQLDILCAGFVPDLQAIGSGLDITVIAGTAVEGGAVITQKGNAEKYRNASTILDIDAVTSAKLGYQRNESAWVITRQYLLDNGVDAQTIAAIEDEATGNVSYFADETALAQAVQKGTVDLGFLPMEYALLYGDAYDLEVVTPAGALQENYVCCREVTSSARLAEKFDAFVAYETARIRAFAYYKQGETDEAIKDDVVKTVAAYSGKEADYVETYLYGGVTKYATDPNTNGIVKYVEAAANSGLLASAGTDFATYDIKQNIDVSAYEQALDALVAREPENAFYAALLEQFHSDN